MFSTLDSGFNGLAMPNGTQVGVSPQKKAKEELKQQCVPVTARVIESLTAGDSSEELHIHGQEVEMVALFGVVELLSVGSASIEFVVNDATGRVKVKHYMTENHQSSQQVALGKYVHVVGSLRSNPTVHISAQFLDAVSSADAISYHMIEAGYAALKLSRSKLEPKTPYTKKINVDAKASMPLANASPITTPLKEAKVLPTTMEGGLRPKMLAHLSREADPSIKPEGVSTTAVLKHFAEVPSEDVLVCLKELVNDGEIFNTIDDDHFGALC